MPQQKTNADNRIETAFRELINFLLLFVKTYLNIIFHPVKFLMSMQTDTDETIDKVSHLIFFLISTFFFVLTVDIIDRNTHLLTGISRNIFSGTLLNIFQFDGLNDFIHLTINQIINISVLKVIFVTLPMLVWVFLYLKIFSGWFFKDKEQREIVRRTFKYFTSAAFFSLIVIFIWEFFFLKFVVIPATGNLNNNYLRPAIPFIVYGIPVLFYVYLLLLPLIASLKAFPKGMKATRKKYILISIILIPLFLVNFKVCILQNNIDAIFNPLSSAQTQQKLEFVYNSTLIMDTINSKVTLEVILHNKNIDHFILDNDSCAAMHFVLDSIDRASSKDISSQTQGGGGSKENGGSGPSSFVLCKIENNVQENKTPYTILKPGDFKPLMLTANIDDNNRAYFNKKNYDNSFMYKYQVSMWGIQGDLDSMQQQFSSNWQKIRIKYSSIK
jgi:hypothetical protein